MPCSITPGRLLMLAALLTSSVAAQPGASPRPSDRRSARPSGHLDRSSIVLPQKPDFVLWDAERKIEPGVVGLAYRIERVDRFNLLLTAPSRGLRGWAPSSSVISLQLAEAFFTQSIVISPNDPFAYLMRGTARAENGDVDGAIRDLEEAINRDAKYVPALVRRASLRRSRLQFDGAQADLDRAIALDGREPSPHVERAMLAFARKEYGKALTDLDRATALGSRDINVSILRGQILLEKKETRRAFEAFVGALQADPTRQDAYLGLASVYLMRGEPRQAQAILDDAVRSDPENSEAYGNRATLDLARRDYERALFNLGEVIRLSPGSARAYNERAWLLATCPDTRLRDGRQAVESATRACELSGGKSPRYLATLAAAYAEAGDYGAAARTQERALSRLAAGSPERTPYQRALDRYRAKKPLRSLGLLEELGIRGRPSGERPSG